MHGLPRISLARRDGIFSFGPCSFSCWPARQGSELVIVCLALLLAAQACARRDAPPTQSPQREREDVPAETRTLRDCNANGVEDRLDIARGTSRDANGNGLPDECELIPPPSPQGPADCNDNGVQDDLDIARGGSRDDNRNGVPDECELLPFRGFRPERENSGIEPALGRRPQVMAANTMEDQT